MRKTALMLRCVPRFGFDNSEVRTIDLDVPPGVEEEELRHAVQFFFSSRGISDALYDIDVDDYGFFAIINDEIYDWDWGTPLL